MPSKTLIGVSVVGHVVLFTSMFVYNAWDIDQLEYRQRSDVRIGVPVPPPQESSGAEAPKVEMRRKQTVKPPKEIVQQKDDKVVREEPPKETGDTSGDGKENGGGNGPPGSTCTGDGCGPVPQDVPVVPEPPKPPPPRVCPGDPGCPPVIVKQTVFAALRTGGKTAIHPPYSVRQQMARDDVDQTIAAVQICLTTSGSIASVTLRRSTKYTDYDDEILREVRQWRYSPHTVNGKPVPACSMVQFQYTMK